MIFDWEKIYLQEKVLHCSTYRARVIGGWLIMNNATDGSWVLAQSTIFISDPNHEWSIE